MLTQVEHVAALLEKEVKDFCEIAVLGISGGVDSAVVASICTSVLGPNNVYLVSMPYGDTDRATFNARSTELADKLGANHLVVPIGIASDELISSMTKSFSSHTGKSEDLDKMTTGSNRSRMRMAVLYALCAELGYRESRTDKPKRARVIGTGNASEDLIGYETKDGDALADLFVIGDLFKSEVYQLAKHYEVPSSILEAPPSAGLYEGQTDAEELGFTYVELEPALSALHRVISRGLSDEEINPLLPDFEKVDPKTASFVVTRFLANAHKHRAPKVATLRHTDFVKDIWAEDS